MTNEKVLDILKIQKTIRKAIKDYSITAKHDDEVLISLVSVDLYLNLTAEDAVTTQLKTKQKAKSFDTSKSIEAPT